MTKKSNKPQEKFAGHKFLIAVDDIWEEGNLRDPGWEKSVNELKTSIQEKGLLQPIGLLQKAKDKQCFKVIFGHRRLAAVRALGQKQIPAQVYAKLGEQEEFAIRLTENAERLNLEPMEEARAYAQAIEKKVFTVNELARAIHRTAGYISQRIGLLKLTDVVKDSLEAGRITATHARELCRITDEKTQKKLLGKAEKIGIEAFRELVANVGEGKIKNSKKGRPRKTKDIKDVMKPRDWEDVNNTLSELNRRQIQAKQREERMKSEYLKGLMRGITWALQLGGAEQLLELEEVSHAPGKVKVIEEPFLDTETAPEQSLTDTATTH